MQKKILIAGCGYVGSRLGQILASQGHSVWGIRRRVHLLPDMIFPLRADLSRSDSLPRLPPSLDHIFYTASSDNSTDQSYRQAYVTGLRHLLSLLREQADLPSRLFYTSSTGVYAQHSGEWVDENSPTKPPHFMGKRLLEGEATAFSSPFPVTIVRLGGIYGPGRTRVIERVYQGKEVCVRGRLLYTNRIHLEDCAGVLVHLMSLSRPHPLYLGVDSEPTDRCQFLRWLAEQLGVPPPEQTADLEEGSRMLRSNKRCRNQRLLQTGYRFIYPTFREGYQALLRTWKSPAGPSDHTENQ